MKKIKYNDTLKIRLDHFLVENINEKRSVITNLIKESLILVNDSKVKPGYLLNNGDEITIFPYEKRSLKLEPKELPLNIIYEDDDLLIINKDKGVVVHPSLSYEGTTLVEGLLYKGISLSNVNESYRQGIVHRLDKDTSGLVIVSKNNESHKILASYFKKHEIKKYYYALVHGVVKNDEGVIDAPIGRNEKNRLKRTVTLDGKNAVTKFKVIKRFSKFTLLECELITGRTHQIRVHLNYINHPIVGDLDYGYNPPIYKGGQLLHSYKLIFIHPTTKKEMVFETPLPNEFNLFISNLL